MSSPIESASPIKARWKGIALALSFVALAGAALAVQWRASRDLRELQRRERAAVQALTMAPTLARDLAAIHAPALHPPEAGALREERFAAARSELAKHIAEFEAAVDDPIARERFQVFKVAMDRLTQEIERELAETRADTRTPEGAPIDRTRVVGRLRAFEERYNEALYAFGNMMSAATLSADLAPLRRRGGYRCHRDVRADGFPHGHRHGDDHALAAGPALARGEQGAG
jgi:hypothetical protein